MSDSNEVASPPEEAVPPPEEEISQSEEAAQPPEEEASQSEEAAQPPEPLKKTKKKKKRTAKSYAIVFFCKLGVTLFALWILLNFILGIFVCHDHSAYPMIKDGDLCITYRLAKLQQGDVIAYKKDGETKFGRIIAFEGDSVEIENDYITVNGYGIFEDTLYPTSSEGASITFPYTVSDNCVFVLNDYRGDVSDSRTYGGISLDDALGKVIFVMRRRGI